MSFNRILTALIAIAIFCSCALADEAQVKSILEEVDSWVTTDTARIMEYIDSANAVTKQMLEDNPYWEPVQRELGFLLGIDLITSPQIDNTGRIYYTMRLTGESEQLFYTDVAMGFPVQITPNSWADEGITISGYSVHPSGDFIIVRTNVHGDEMHDLWRFERNGKFKVLLEDRNVRFVGPIFDEDNPDQFYLYTQSGPMHICRYTMSTGVLDTIYTEEGAFYPVDYDKGKLIWVRYLSFSEAHLMLLDVGTGEVKSLTQSGLTWGGAFTEDGDIGLLTTVKSSDDEFMKFCMIDKEDIIEAVDPEDIKVIYDPKAEVEDYTFIKKLNTVVAAANYDGYSKLIGFDLQGNPVTVPQTEIGIATSIASNDLGDVVFAFSSPTTAPTCYSFKLGGTELEQIGKVSTFGFDFSNIGVDVIRYKSDDGMEIPALLYVPKDAKRDGMNPAIVNYHGGPPSQSRPYFQRNIAYALSKGFVMMFPNVRGSTGYGPAYERMDNLEGRFDALTDAERAIDYLIDNKLSSPDRIAIWGGSYGGYTVNWLATQCSDKIACVVSEVGVSDVDWTNEKSKNQNFAKGWEHEMGEVGSELTHDLSPIFMADQITVPILVTTGFFDPRVPPSDPRRFSYVLSRLGKQVWYYEETEAGHGGSMKQQIVFDLSRNYAFTMQYLMK
jgi:dipeptidyl aminopeptidase/acylaminoacyl peptidase